MSKSWWQNAVVYQIYPKSFKDTNHDGIGDIAGIIESLDYIKSIGVNTLWLNPIFISPQIDNGYDVSNYYAIDPIFGSLEDVEKLIDEAHQRDIKILFDLVLNHTSNQHPWFKEALKGPDNIYRDYYLWQKPAENENVPNNWASFFGGSVWEKDELSNDYYFHLFAKEMPDLNWKNREVRRAMLDIALFWLDKGIDGFRLDAFIHMAKADFSLQVENIPLGDIAIAEEYYANLPSVVPYLSEFIGKLRAVKPDIFIIGEAASATPKLAKEYIGETLCNTVISFDHFTEKIVEKNGLVPKEIAHRTLDIPNFKKKIKAWQEELADTVMPTLYWNNHDMPRVVSRFGNTAEYRLKSSLSLATAMYLLRGIPVIYYGEEIGMKNLEITNINLFSEPKAMGHYIHLLENGFDRIEALNRITNVNKEASRGAMQWDGTINAGFSSKQPWLGVNEEKTVNIEFENEDQTSTLAHYRFLLELKATPLFEEGQVTFLETSEFQIAYERRLGQEGALILCNLSERTSSVPEWLANYSDWTIERGTNDQLPKTNLAPYDFYLLKNK